MDDSKWKKNKLYFNNLTKRISSELFKINDLKHYKSRKPQYYLLFGVNILRSHPHTTFTSGENSAMADPEEDLHDLHIIYT